MKKTLAYVLLIASILNNGSSLANQRLNNDLPEGIDLLPFPTWAPLGTSSLEAPVCSSVLEEKKDFLSNETTFGGYLTELVGMVSERFGQVYIEPYQTANIQSNQGLSTQGLLEGLKVAITATAMVGIISCLRGNPLPPASVTPPLPRQ